MSDYENQRKYMVDCQLRARDIRDPRVLAALEKVPRHRFVPASELGDAYNDHPIPIGSGQTISQPYMVALMTELLHLRGDEKVLEIGSGSGYQAAVLAELSRTVITIERVSSLSERARMVLEELGYHNITLVVGDGSLGYPVEAPYDAIIVTAAAPKIAQPWLDQLAEGGRLVAPIGNRWSQILTVVEKRGDNLIQKNQGACIFVPLRGEYGWDED